MPDIDIDGKVYSVKAGDNLLKACLSLGLDLPYFCWHPALGSVGACRQCAVVQFQNPDDAKGRIVMACMTPVADGLRIGLQHADARAFRADIIELLMTNHPHDCPVCEEGGECHLQDMTGMTGHTARRYRGPKRTHRNQNLGPFINHEMNRCIACYRCLRYYGDYCGGSDLQAFAAHNHVYFGRVEDGALQNEFSGNLVEVCPTGVFTDKTFSRHYARRWDLQSAPSVCVHCGLGCNTSPGERYGTLRRIVNRYHGDVNGYFLCDRGRFGYDFVNGDKRVTRARVKNQPPLSGQGAANHFVDLLRKAKGVVGIGSPRASLETNFALRALVGADRFHAGVAGAEFAAMQRTLTVLRDWPLRIASLRDVERADALLVLGDDPTQTAPRLALALRQATRNQSFELADRLRVPRWQEAAVRCAAQQQRSPLFIASCAPNRLDDVAALNIRATPDELARLGFAVAHELIADAPEPAGLDADTADHTKTIAAALRSAKRPLVVADAMLADAAAQIAKAVAELKGSPTDVHVIVPDCNSLGLAMLAGHPLAEAFDAVDKGLADTVVVVENDLYRRAGKADVDRMLNAAKQVVVIDHCEHPTAMTAELVLPAASFAESEGSLVSSEGRAQRYFAVFPPREDIAESWFWLGFAAGKPWAHIDELTQACADEFPELALVVAAAPDAGLRISGRRIPRQPHRYSGRTAMLADRCIHEPKQMIDGESALAFSMEGAESGRPAALTPSVWAPGWNSNQAVTKFQDEVGGHCVGGDPGLRLFDARNADASIWLPLPPPSAESDRLQLVPLQHIFGSEELSALAPAVAERMPAPYLALHPTDAAGLGLQQGDPVIVTVSATEVSVPVRIMPDLAPGVAGLPWGLPGMPWFEAGTRDWTVRRRDAAP